MSRDEPRDVPGESALLRSLVDNMSTMLAYWGSDLRCRFANRAYQRWFGVAPESVIGAHIHEMLGPLYELNRPYIEAVLRGEPQEFEREIPDPKGGPPRQGLAYYVPDVAEGVVRGFFVMVSDVSRIKRVEAELAESEARFSGIVSSAADAIISIDDEQRIVLFNQGAEDIFGWSADEVLGEPLDILIPERFRAIHRKHVREFAAAEVTSRRIAERHPEIFGVRKSGEEFPAEASISKLELGEKTLLTAFMRDISARKRSEDERRVFTALLENSSDFIGIADPDGTPVYLNPAGRRMVGLPPDYPIESTEIPDYYPPEQRELARTVILRSMLERGRWSGETYFRHWQTEEPIPVSDEHFMIRDPRSGRVLGMGTVTRDISEARRAAREREDLLARERQAREQAESANERLRESEERFRLTIDAAPIGMALVALDGRFVRVNRVLCEIVGYTAEELTGLTFQSITHPEDLETDLSLAGQLARGEIPRYQLEKRYLKKDGSVVDIMLSGAAVRDREGEPRYFIAQIEDITERKRLEEEQRFLADIGPVLAGSLEYEETLTKIAEVAVKDFADLCIVDLVEEDRRVRRVKVASRDPSTTWLTDFLTEMPPDRQARNGPYLFQSVLQTGRPSILQRPSDDVLAQLAQGEERLRALRAADIGSLMAVPLHARGNLLGVMAFIASRSSRRYAAADVRLAEEIARRAALSIENSRLYCSARAATRARDELMAVVAHDLRNPLSTILMQATFLRAYETEPDHRARDVAGAIERAATRMVRLVQDLLDVTAMEGGHLSIACRRVPSERLVSSVLEAHESLAGASALELRSDLARDLPDVWADRDRLLQVFENLIGNALKFTEPGGWIEVGARARGSDVLFWVADSGAGIPQDDLQHVFDRFWQARKSDRQGAGLGLPIVKGIVEAHGGRIWVESEPDGGSQFFFTIPTAQEDRVQLRW